MVVWFMLFVDIIYADAWYYSIINNMFVNKINFKKMFLPTEYNVILIKLIS